MQQILSGAAPRVVTGFFDSTPLLSNPEALRERAAEDGFLFFKSLLPKEPLLTLRRQILEIIAARGWLKDGTDLMDGIGDIDAIAREEKLDSKWQYFGVGEDAYRAVQHLELFHALPHHPRLLSLYQTLFGAPVLPHPRNIARVLLPTPTASPTPPHQDYIHIQGTHQCWTCWFPLGDCPMEMGGLSILRGSHREDVLAVSAAPGTGSREVVLCQHDYEWVQDNYECGDVLTFGSHTIHKALPTQRKDRIRLSCDNRYQPADQDIEENSLQPHMNIATWEEIYRGWKRDDFKYYWKSHELKFSPFDRSLIEQVEKIC